MINNLSFTRFSSEFKNAFSVLRLDVSKIASIYESSSEKFFPVFFLAVPPVLNLIFAMLSFSSFGAIFSRFVLWPIVIPFLSVVAAAFIVCTVLKKWLKISIKYLGIFRVVCYSSVVLWASTVVFLLDAVGILQASNLSNLIFNIGAVWMVIVMYKFLFDYLKIAQNNAYIVLAVYVIGYLLSQKILGSLFVGSYYRIF
ncbi:hypothetical protein A3B60_03505 [Candidatus Peregrinibacteria bacterium RIFCSPLOWO2_01_FULL_39_12]|nr:MAG: hypothetical protein A3I58_01655 [Candidatus Peregrinibacteria bacterium RIFCSPLOWO2_02_FULL_39_10]OGJ42911.1 MAG: hypothetical protein A3B60_03505 [Candidatus Peregrinibacteria bacterium RIFCSPLOWO2_01_FULL_39_12]